MWSASVCLCTGIDWQDYPGPLFNNWQEAAQFVISTPLSDVDRLQANIQDWYHNVFKKRIMSTVEDAVLARYPRLAHNAAAYTIEDMHSIHMLKAENIWMKLDTANLIDYAKKLEADIVTLAGGVNSLLSANQIYNNRIRALEKELNVEL